MRTIVKFKWLLLAAWLAAAVGLFALAPDMQQLVRDKGQIDVPQGYPSKLAEELLADMNVQRGSGQQTSMVLVLYDERSLSGAGMAEAEKAIAALEAQKESIGIAQLISPLDQPELRDKMLSEDGTTMLTLVSVEWQGRTVGEVRELLYGALAGIGIEYYLTGGDLVGEDVIVSSEKGLKKTELFTVGFILIILLVVFRSAIAPFIPLVTVGISYLVSQSVVAFLVDRYDFPLSNFTQIFMVAVMFGIGTDYCILLISRFKEELSHGRSKVDAVIETYRSGGKTVLFAGLAVMIGFASIGFSTFILYKSAVAVAVGVGVLLLALFTIVPFFMAALGPALFWPSRGSIEHKDSKLWEAAGRFSLRRPVLTLALIAALLVPLLYSYDGKVSYNSMEEIGEDYDSVKAFSLIERSFGPGETMPGTLVLRSEDGWDHPEGLSVIERISREVAALDGVDYVRSATRPAGDPLEELRVSRQAELLGDGLGEGVGGLEQIRAGLAEAAAGLAASAPELDSAAAGADELAAGTLQLRAGILELQGALSALEQGVRDGSAGAAEIRQGLEQAQASAAVLAGAGQELVQGYEQAGAGLQALEAHYVELENSLLALSQAADGAQQGLELLASKYPALSQDPDFLMIQGAVAAIHSGLHELAAGMGQLNGQLAAVAAGVSEANQGLGQLAGGQQALADGLAALAQGLGELAGGLGAAADGQSRIAAEMPAVAQGLGQLGAGQEQLAAGFREFGGELGRLVDGLDQSADGLAQVTDGLQQVRAYLGELSAETDSGAAGVFIPQELLDSPEFAPVLETYMSPDRKSTTLDIVFAGNPYAVEMLDQVEPIYAAVERILKDTPWAGAEAGISGVTGMHADLRSVSDSDYSRTVILMLAGIALVLILLLRSLIMPLYLMLSLILTYYTSLAVTELIFVNMLGYSGLSWAVTFFAYVILLALGIDYSIFLMDRFNEYKHLPAREAILMAMRKMGTVIISAVIILGGTFAAMYPSGVLSLLQIATIVITGLILYALVFLPFFVPVMVQLFGKANWWPMKVGADKAAGSGSGLGAGPAGPDSRSPGV